MSLSTKERFSGGRPHINFVSFIAGIDDNDGVSFATTGLPGALRVAVVADSCSRWARRLLL